MKISKAAKQLALDLGLSEADAYIMELKSQLYSKSANLIQESVLTHGKIAQLMGTSRSRINRIAHHAESNVSIELLIKLIAVLEGRPIIKFAA
jgi:predicted XRE-type DNA-binding protein